MQSSAAQRHAKRFDRVLLHIEQHLDDELSLETLSEVAHFSRFHFHRAFSSYVGVSVARYVQHMRLRRASHRLLSKPTDGVLDIALQAGFNSAEAFSRAFKRTFGQSPTAFRQQPEWHAWNAAFVISPFIWSIIMQVDIVEFPATRIAALKFRGPVRAVPQTVQAFIAWRQASSVSPVDRCKSFGIAHNNPDTAPNDFHFDVCGELLEGAQVASNPQGVVEDLIPGGRCARVRHLGQRNRLGETIYPLYRDWLPTSGETPRDFPLFFHYVTVVPGPDSDNDITDIYLPLK
ncbi:GyrI-like domain-containing protein [Acidithiobacillus sp. IBUN Pt1247-S3]|uniref:AraC family transcriptional regulator n=1 Tax=Acidithiobacillus sp. IBUN Pt1247-S3 TaxID=3166642 RepID=UPI0034E47EF6